MILKCSLLFLLVIGCFANTSTETKDVAKGEKNADDKFEYQIEDNRSKLTDQDYEKAEDSSYDYEEEDFADLEESYNDDGGIVPEKRFADIVEDTKSFYDIPDNEESNEWGEEKKRVEKKAVNDVKDDLDSILDIYEDLEKENNKTVANEQNTDSNELTKTSDEVVDNNVLRSNIVSEGLTTDEVTTTTEPLEEKEKTTVTEDIEVHPVEHLDVSTDDDDKEYTTEELDALMTEFAKKHKAELNTEAESFDRHISPVYLTLEKDEMIEISSPNYPNSYSGYNIFDYIIESADVGVQIDILDLNLRGKSGDYLLIKPGGLDDTTHDSLVFSYRRGRNWSNTFDVNKIFIRFELRGGRDRGRGRATGFKLTIQNKVKTEDTNSPSTGMITNEVQQNDGETFALHVFGVGEDDFDDISNDFKNMLVNMAELYVKENNIYAVENSLSQFTNIETITSCSDTDAVCTKVVFSIPLPTDDDSLTEGEMVDMWRTYSHQEEFRRQMDDLGVDAREAFKSSSRMSWSTSIAISVMIIALASMMAVITVRWMARRNYTKMAAFQDAESISNMKNVGYDFLNDEKKCGDVVFEKEITKGSSGEFVNNALENDLPPPYTADNYKK